MIYNFAQIFRPLIWELLDVLLACVAVKIVHDGIITICCSMKKRQHRNTHQPHHAWWWNKPAAQNQQSRDSYKSRIETYSVLSLKNLFQHMYFGVSVSFLFLLSIWLYSSWHNNVMVEKEIFLDDSDIPTLRNVFERAHVGFGFCSFLMNSFSWGIENQVTNL